MNHTGPLVLFDGICNLCSFSVQFLATKDRENKIRYALVQSQTGQDILSKHNLPLDSYDSFILVEDGKLYFKSTAFLKLVRYMKWPWPLLGVASIVPKALRDCFYDRIARNRYRLFGKRQSCMIPKDNIADRFLP